jgi:hypothetical protein
MERMVTMFIHHTTMTTQLTPRKAVLAFVFAMNVFARDTETLLKEVTVTIVTK